MGAEFGIYFQENAHRQPNYVSSDSFSISKFVAEFRSGRSGFDGHAFESLQRCGTRRSDLNACYNFKPGAPRGSSSSTRPPRTPRWPASMVARTSGRRVAMRSQSGGWSRWRHCRARRGPRRAGKLSNDGYFYRLSTWFRGFVMRGDVLGKREPTCAAFLSAGTRQAMGRGDDFSLRMVAGRGCTGRMAQA
jgi:hypothetical protein